MRRTCTGALEPVIDGLTKPSMGRRLCDQHIHTNCIQPSKLGV
jgi:hypothetical protein